MTTADSGHVLILINGRPTRETLEGGVSSEVFEAFPVSIIERIEVIRGPGSVLHGPNAFSAVINIITEKNSISIPDEKTDAYFGLDYRGLSLSSMYNQWNHSYFYQGTVGDNLWRRAFGDLGYHFSVSEKLR